MNAAGDALRMWMSRVEGLLGFIYPNVCQICGEERAGAGEGFVGAQCRQRVRFINPPFCDRCGLPFQGDITTAFKCANCHEMELHFRWARSAVVARDAVLEIIHRYKYQRALWFEPFLADLLIRHAGADLGREKWSWIVPVPLHPLKKREREFNQAERLAARISAATGIPVNTRLLKRVVATRTQTLLSRRERSQNVGRAFAMQDRMRLNGERILLLDDVLTTGATTSACAKVLLAAGAGEVCVWTVARGL